MRFFKLFIILTICLLEFDNGSAKGLFKSKSPGLKGDKGRQGIKGTTGKKGDKGSRGSPGHQGPPGLPGLHGSKGEKGSEIHGLPGLKGPTGEKGDQGAPGKQGPKGAPGSVRVHGIKGDTGSPGPSGIPGPQGIMGPPGSQGNRGDNGYPGPPGAQGYQGPPGQKGDTGERGMIGPVGSQGKTGPTGTPGPVGPPGPPGKECDCSHKPVIGNDIPGITATENIICKNNFRTNDTGPSSLPPQKGNFKVICNQTTHETCLRSTGKTNFIKYTGKMYIAENGKANDEYKYKNQPFWLSEAEVDLTHIYDVSPQQLNWLRANSKYVKQTLRYHCRNSTPYSTKNASISIRMLTWNDVVIGPSSTDATPLFYIVPSDTDKCSEGGDIYKSSDIIIHSNKVHRLPIIDIQIRDIRYELQEFYIESIEMCFG